MVLKFTPFKVRCIEKLVSLEVLDRVIAYHDDFTVSSIINGKIVDIEGLDQIIMCGREFTVTSIINGKFPDNIYYTFKEINGYYDSKYFSAIGDKI